MNKAKLIGTIAAVACIAGATTASATLVTYDWVPSETQTGPSSGTVTINTSTGTVQSIDFVGTSILTGITDVVNNPAGLTYTIVAGGNLVLNGSTAIANNPTAPLSWFENPGYSVMPGLYGNAQQIAIDSIYVSGDWVVAPVPEPTTVISGALMALPFGASALRVIRRKKSV